MTLKAQSLGRHLQPPTVYQLLLLTVIFSQHCFHFPYVRGSVKSSALLSKTSVLNANETLPRFPSEGWQQPVLRVHAHSSCRKIKKGKMILGRKFSFSVEACFMPSLSRAFPQCKQIISTSKLQIYHKRWFSSLKKSIWKYLNPIFKSQSLRNFLPSSFPSFHTEAKWQNRTVWVDTYRS